MKNWCKIIETEDDQILVTKSYDEEADKYKINVQTKVSGIEIKTGLGYEQESVRDEDWSRIQDEHYLVMASKAKAWLM